MATVEEVCEFIVDYMRRNDATFSHWYVGITDDPGFRIFEDHGVSRDQGKWAYKKTDTETMARAVEKLIKETYGTKGGTSIGNEQTTFVYAYLITPATKE